MLASCSKESTWWVCFLSRQLAAAPLNVTKQSSWWLQVHRRKCAKIAMPKTDKLMQCSGLMRFKLMMQHLEGKENDSVIHILSLSLICTEGKQKTKQNPAILVIYGTIKSRIIAAVIVSARDLFIIDIPSLQIHSSDTQSSTWSYKLWWHFSGTVNKECHESRAEG